MATWKKIVYPIAAVVLLAGYIALAAFVLNTFFKPSEASGDGVNFGGYHIKSVDGLTDPKIDNDETAFTNIDGRLLHNDDAALRERKLVTLYEVSLLEGQNAAAEVEIEIPEELYKDPTLAVVYRNEALDLELVDARKELRTKEGGEQYRVIVFEVREAGFYGIVSQRKVARYDWLLAVFCIATVCGLFVILFIALDAGTKRHRAKKDSE